MPAFFRCCRPSLLFFRPSSLVVLFHPHIRRFLAAVFPDAQNFQFGENVACMPLGARALISDTLALPCYSLCPAGLSPVRRPRYYWFDWALAPCADFSVSEDVRGLRSVHFRIPSTAVDPAFWAEADWWPVGGSSAIFPTFTTPKSNGRPGSVPAGLQRASQDAISRWRADAFCFPPFQYESRFGMVYKGDPASWRLPSVQERQLLLNFRCFHTEACFPRRTRRLTLPILNPSS